MPPWINSGHGIPRGATPVYRRVVGGGQIIVANGSTTSFVTFGGNNFPINTGPGSGIAGQIMASVRDDAGDRDIFVDIYDAAAFTPPPFYVWQWRGQSGDLFDNGGSGFVNDAQTCINAGNNGSWQAAAGVTRSVSRTMDVEIRTSSLPLEAACNGLAVFYREIYTLDVVFTG